MKRSLDKLTVKGFKSIRELDAFPMSELNILIGANGAGKSNFIDFFRLIRAMMALPLPTLSNASLGAFIANGGGSDDFLFGGPKTTSRIEVEMLFGENGYRFTLAPTADETMLINDEARLYTGGSAGWWSLGGGHPTPSLLKDKDEPGVRGDRNGSAYIYDAIASWKIYHFHDTGMLAPMRRAESIDDVEYMRFDGANIAPFLLHLREQQASVYRQIIDTVRLVTPFFDDFILKPNSQEKVRLNWKQKGSDYPLKPHHLSDGTIRFICLTTALLQPDPPSTIVIDEPELGLHPYAIDVLAELLKAASRRMQVIVSTQSPALIDCFDPEHVVVVNRHDGATEFKRLDAAQPIGDITMAKSDCFAT